MSTSRALLFCSILVTACGSPTTAAPEAASPAPAEAAEAPPPAPEPRVILGSYRVWTGADSGAFATLTGGGGSGWGTIGTGRYGTIGHGSGSGSGSGYGRGAARPAPRIRLEPPVVRGALDKAIVRRYLRRSLARMRLCYDRALSAKPGLAGKVEVDLVIDAKGDVPTARATGVSPQVANCVASAVRAIKFPKPKSSLVQVRFAIELSPPAKKPVTTAGNPITAGSLSKEQIRRVIRSRLRAIKLCYERQLVTDPSLQGKVVVNFVIAPDGSVSSARGTGMNGKVSACVVAQVEKMRFPKPTGGGVVQVRYPFVFKSAGGPPKPPEPAPPAADEGKMGHEDSDRRRGQYAIGRDLELARNAGILGALQSCERAEPPAPIRSLPDAVTACYREARADHPALGGVVNAKLTLGDDGAVTRVEADGPAPLVACVKKAAATLALPAEEDQEARRTVGFSLAFDSGAPASAGDRPVLSLVPGVVQFEHRSRRFDARSAPGAVDAMARRSVRSGQPIAIRIAGEVDGWLAGRLLASAFGQLQLLEDGAWRPVPGFGVGAFWRQRCAATPPAIVVQIGDAGLWLSTPRGRVEIPRRGAGHDTGKLAGVLGKLRPVVGSESLIELRPDRGTRFADIVPVVETVIDAGFFEPSFRRSSAPDPRSMKR